MSDNNSNNDIFVDSSAAGYSGKGEKGYISISTGEGSGAKDIVLAVVEVGGTVEDALQIMKSFTGNIAVTTFGQAVSMYNITCIKYTKACDKADELKTSVKDIFKDLHIDQKNPPKLTMVIDDLIIHGFLFSMPIKSGVDDRGRIEYTLQIFGQAVI